VRKSTKKRMGENRQDISLATIVVKSEKKKIKKKSPLKGSSQCDKGYQKKKGKGETGTGKETTQNHSAGKKKKKGKSQNGKKNRREVTQAPSLGAKEKKRLIKRANRRRKEKR